MSVSWLTIRIQFLRAQKAYVARMKKGTWSASSHQIIDLSHAGHVPINGSLKVSRWYARASRAACGKFPGGKTHWASTNTEVGTCVIK